MKTTLALEDDAAEIVLAYSKKRGITLGKAASELIRRGASYQIGIRRINGFPVFDVPEDFPAITTEQVRKLLSGSTTPKE
ncbi:MAG: antitoxin [Terriglobia bacterium]